MEAWYGVVVVVARGRELVLLFILLTCGVTHS